MSDNLKKKNYVIYSLKQDNVIFIGRLKENKNQDR